MNLKTKTKRAVLAATMLTTGVIGAALPASASAGDFYLGADAVMLTTDLDYGFTESYTTEHLRVKGGYEFSNNFALEAQVLSAASDTDADFLSNTFELDTGAIVGVFATMQKRRQVRPLGRRRARPHPRQARGANPPALLGSLSGAPEEGGRPALRCRGLTARTMAARAAANLLVEGQPRRAARLFTAVTKGRGRPTRTRALGEPSGTKQQGVYPAYTPSAPVSPSWPPPSG